MTQIVTKYVYIQILDIWWPFAFKSLTKHVQTGPGTPEVLRANKSVFLGEVRGGWLHSNGCGYHNNGKHASSDTKL